MIIIHKFRPNYYFQACETNCSHRFCNYCLTTWFYQRGTRICPSCRSEIHEVRGLPELNERVEKYVVDNFTEEQKQERETSKTTRETAQQHLTTRNFDDEDNPFEIEIMEQDFEAEFELTPRLDTHGYEFSSYEGLAGRAVRVLPRAIFTAMTEPGNPNVPNVAFSNRVNTQIYTSTATPGGDENNSTSADDYGTNSFQMLEDRLNSVEASLRTAPLDYNRLMDFQLVHDIDGIFVRRIYDRFNALGLVDENQRAQWAGMTPFEPTPEVSDAPRTSTPANPDNSAGSDMTSPQSSTTPRFGPAVNNSAAVPPPSNNSAAPRIPIQRIPLDSTGWLTYLHNSRHNGEHVDSGSYNDWESYLNSNPGLDQPPASNPNFYQHQYPSSNPETPNSRQRENIRTEAQGFSSPHYFSNGFNTFITARRVGREEVETPETGETVNVIFDATNEEEVMDRSIQNLTDFHRHLSSQDSRQCHHRCHIHGHSSRPVDSDHDYDTDNTSAPHTAGYSVSESSDDDDEDDDDDDGEGHIRIQFVVRPTAPERVPNYSAESI